MPSKVKVNTKVIRLFVTGASPVTMDDVTSGFNLGTIGYRLGKCKRIAAGWGFW